MADPTQGNSNYDAAHAMIEIEADGIARAHRLDPTRVLRVFERTAQDYYGNPLPAAAPGIDTLDRGLRFSPSLDHALAYLPAEVALGLFETEDLDQLRQRIAVTDFLAESETPFYTLGQLADLTEAFASYLEHNREHIVETGYPRSLFQESQWLDRNLTRLYTTKLPMRTAVVEDQIGDPVYAYAWPDRAAESLDFPPPPPGIRIVGFGRGYMWGPDGSAYTDDGTRVRSCSYEEAALVSGLSVQDAMHLERTRPRIFDLKIAVLRRLLRSLRGRGVGNLWEDCLRLLTESLTATEAEYFLRIDRFYSGFDLLSGEVVDERADLVAGGLTDLLQFVGHCEKELTIGTMHRTAQSLASLPADASFSSYYETVGQPWQPLVNAALDLFVELDIRERAFWADYRVRVNDALENEFYEEVVIRTRVKRKLVSLFEPHVRTFAAWQKAHLEATGMLPGLQISQPSERVQSRANRFRKDGDFWTIVYQGKEVFLRDTKGLRHISYLLASPGQEFHVLDLDAAEREHQPDLASEGYSGMGTEQLANEGLHASGLGDAGSGLDQQAKYEYKRRLAELKEEQEDVRLLGNWQREDQIQEEIDAITTELAAAYGLGGRERKVASAAEKARVNVKKQIDAARDRIASENPDLGQHLRNAIKTGMHCCYKPDHPIHWEC